MADFIWINNECDQKFSSFIKTIDLSAINMIKTNYIKL